ncbi:zinc ribbon domain-containing protein [Candidatus Bathyarchaeota archaeon]|nr:zinc ribbon domain-containing protein [Candidatus Bathyarchaeota archaeon]
MAQRNDMTAGEIAVVVGLLFSVLGFLFILLSSIIPPFSPILNWSILALVMGIVLILVGIIMKTKEKTLPVQTTFSSQNNAVTKEKETIVKEVVMLPCQYCGSLMPQTSLFCPHCGARRKS